MPSTTAQRVAHFRSLHEAPGAFVIANAWDPGSARILAGMGFAAIATSSSAHAGTLGRLDGRVSREEALAHCRALVAATDVPVSADLEKGFGDFPREAAETIRLAGGAGLAGGSIEDASGDRAKPIYDFAHAVERVAAAVEAARSLPNGFVLTARAEGYFHGAADRDEIIRRLQAFERAGADVLFAPGVPDLESVRTICASLTKPVNFMVGIRGRSFTVADLQAAGVKRISLAGSLYRAAMSGLLDAAREVHDHGTFTYLDRVPPSAEFAQYFD